VAAEEVNQTLLGGRKSVDKYKLKNDAFRKAAVEMCEMLTYLSRTEHDIKN